MIELAPLRDRINALSRATLSSLPLDFWQGAFPKDLIALCYHVVSDEDLQHVALYPYKTSAQFEADLVYAKARTVTYRQVVGHRLHGLPLSPNSLLFTFDDGLAQCYDVVRPILRRHSVDGVFFVTTDYLDDREPFLEFTISRCLRSVAAAPLELVLAVLERLDRQSSASTPNEGRERAALHRLRSVRIQSIEPERRRLFLKLLSLEIEDRSTVEYICRMLNVDLTAPQPEFMSRDQVRQLAADGFTIGAHGVTHRSLVGSSAENIEREIVASCEVVKDLTGQRRVPFAFPYSGIGIDRNALADILRRNPLVELVFDSGNLRRDRDFVVNRVFTDAPPPTLSTNVPEALRAAWSIPSAWFRNSGT